jgi:hypothetical protein
MRGHETRPQEGACRGSWRDSGPDPLVAVDPALQLRQAPLDVIEPPATSTSEGSTRRPAGGPSKSRFISAANSASPASAIAASRTRPRLRSAGSKTSKATSSAASSRSRSEKPSCSHQSTSRTWSGLRPTAVVPVTTLLSRLTRCWPPPSLFGPISESPRPRSSPYG